VGVRVMNCSDRVYVTASLLPADRGAASNSIRMVVLAICKECTVLFPYCSPSIRLDTKSITMTLHALKSVASDWAILLNDPLATN
jgi:hypothetical protein